MIERLNFYDVYGYLIPGVSLLGVLWFPHWFVGGLDLPAAWSSAIVVLFLGYLAGHAIARLGALAFPHGRPVGDESGQSSALRRPPSDYLLDTGDRAIQAEVKGAIISAIDKRFGLNVRDEHPEGDRQPIARTRQVAFMLCRRALLQKKVGSYAEQFEALYTLMRGWTVVAFLSLSYAAGWVAGSVVPQWASAAAVALLGGAFTVRAIIDYRLDRDVRRGRRALPQYQPWPFRILCGFVLALGSLLGSRPHLRGALTLSSMATLVGAATLSGILGSKFHGAYHYFANHFAETVYRDFYVLERYGHRPDEDQDQD